VAKATFMRGGGCTYCHHTGYRGRKGIFELLRMNSSIRNLTFERQPTQTIRRQSRLHGMRTLLEDGVAKAVAGITTLEEVLSICHREYE
jgi:type IV pilus assembly protein PilB